MQSLNQTNLNNHNNGHLVRDTLADFTRDRRVLILSALAMIIGVVSAFVAYALVWLIGLITNLSFYQRIATSFVSPAGNHLGWLVILPPMIGGLIVGLMARYGSEAIRGHGIPEALEAILIGRSRISLKVAILKPISSAISIGTGGPFGAEGPIIMTGGAFGSLFAQAFNLSSIERRTLLVAGAAGGMAAIFSAPVAAALLAVELLLFEWRPRSFIPVALASATAAIVRVPLLGNGPIFPVVPHVPLSSEGLVISLAVGILAGLGSSILTILVYGFEDLFRKLPIHWMWWPIIGGLIVGIGGFIEPRALGVGYDTIRSLLRDNLIGTAALVLLIVKTLIWSISLGSGTSGGVLAPLLIIGGALGAIEAHWIPVGDPSVWVLISMGAIMSGTMRSPFTSIVFMLELTHDVNVLPALLISCVAADAVTVLLMRRSILTEKVARRGHHLFREYGVDPLSFIQVGEVMDRSPITVPADMTVRELYLRFVNAAYPLKHQAFMILDKNGQLAGIITLSDIIQAMQHNEDATQSVLEAGHTNLVVTYPDELLSAAVGKMLVNNINRLPVVSRENPHELVGYLGRRDVIDARIQQLKEETERERGWVIPTK
jgi:H+/Cl- antiporter ClcA